MPKAIYYLVDTGGQYEPCHRSLECCLSPQYSTTVPYHTKLTFQAVRYESTYSYKCGKVVATKVPPHRVLSPQCTLVDIVPFCSFVPSFGAFPRQNTRFVAGILLDDCGNKGRQLVDLVASVSGMRQLGAVRLTLVATNSLTT
jgi:hypothetical protein